MKVKKYFYFNEVKVAEDVIRNGFGGKGIDYGKMYIMAKYFKEVLGYNGDDLERELVLFCQKHDPSFNPVISASEVKRWLLAAEKYNLRRVDHVTITEKELGILSNIKKPRERKILFIALVLAKARKKGNTRIGKTEFRESDNYYIKYDNFADIIRLANFPSLTEHGVKKALYNNKHLITQYYPEKELIKLEYADSAETGFAIYDLENISDSYEVFFGQKLNRCERCGKVYSKMSNRQKYCVNCRAEEKRRTTREAMRKKREENKEM